MRAKERGRGLGLQRGGKATLGKVRRECLANKRCSALQLSLSDEKVISGNSYFPGTGLLSNVNFP